jgi:hypothetical protein
MVEATHLHLTGSARFIALQKKVEIDSELTKKRLQKFAAFFFIKII